MGKARPEILGALHELRFKRFTNSRSLPAPDKGMCKWCGGKASRVWCSKECRREAYVRFGYVDGYIFERDKGVCAICGIDAHWVRGRCLEIKRAWGRYRTCDYAELVAGFGPWSLDFCRRLWEADHIIAVSEGGGCCGLENYQTLCLKCHKEETAKLSKTRAKRKRPIPEMLFSMNS